MPFQNLGRTSSCGLAILIPSPHQLEEMEGASMDASSLSKTDLKFTRHDGTYVLNNPKSM